MSREEIKKENGSELENQEAVQTDAEECTEKKSALRRRERQIGRAHV